MNYFYYFNKDTDLDELLVILYREYPQYIQQPIRLKSLIATIKTSEITMVVETGYVDKQYRDTYYSYFSQKYSSFNRNCSNSLSVGSYNSPFIIFSLSVISDNLLILIFTLSVSKIIYRDGATFSVGHDLLSAT